MSKKIAVIGAGPMGLAVAYQLALDGFSPVLFEADDRVGGMTACFDFDGIDIERYYHFHCISDEAFLQLLDELDIADKMRWTATKMGFYYQKEVHPWGTPPALLKFPHLGWVAKFRYGLHAFLSTKRNNWKPLDKLEATSWIKKWVGDEAYDVLWKKLFDFKFYEYAHSLSAAWIWSRIRRIGRSRYNLMKEKLGYLEGGSPTLLNALSSSIISHGGDIRLSTAVQKIVIEDGILRGVETKDGFEAFDTVISTIPIQLIPSLAPALPKEINDAYAAIPNIAVVCVIVKLKKPLTENFWLNVNDDRMDIPGIVEYTNLRPMDNSIVYIPYYMPSTNPKYTEDDEVYREKALSYMQEINAELSDSDFIDIKVHRYQYAQPICGMNFFDGLPSEKTPVDGLLIADTTYYYPEDRGISESIGYGRNLVKKYKKEN